MPIGIITKRNKAEFLINLFVSLGTKKGTTIEVTSDISWATQVKMNEVKRMLIIGEFGIKTRTPAVSAANQMWY